MIFLKFIKEKENSEKNRDDWWLWAGSNFELLQIAYGNISQKNKEWK